MNKSTISCHESCQPLVEYVNKLRSGSAKKSDLEQTAKQMKIRTSDMKVMAEDTMRQINAIERMLSRAVVTKKDAAGQPVYDITTVSRIQCPFQIPTGAVEKINKFIDTIAPKARIPRENVIDAITSGKITLEFAAQSAGVTPQEANTLIKIATITRPETFAGTEFENTGSIMMYACRGIPYQETTGLRKLTVPGRWDPATDNYRDHRGYACVHFQGYDFKLDPSFGKTNENGAIKSSFPSESGASPRRTPLTEKVFDNSIQTHEITDLVATPIKKHQSGFPDYSPKDPNSESAKSGNRGGGGESYAGFGNLVRFYVDCAYEGEGINPDDLMSILPMEKQEEWVGGRAGGRAADEEEYEEDDFTTAPGAGPLNYKSQADAARQRALVEQEKLKEVKRRRLYDPSFKLVDDDDGDNGDNGDSHTEDIRIGGLVERMILADTTINSQFLPSDPKKRQWAMDVIDKFVTDNDITYDLINAPTNITNILNSAAIKAYSKDVRIPIPTINKVVYLSNEAFRRYLGRGRDLKVGPTEAILDDDEARQMAVDAGASIEQVMDMPDQEFVVDKGVNEDGTVITYEQIQKKKRQLNKRNKKGDDEEFDDIPAEGSKISNSFSEFKKRGVSDRNIMNQTSVDDNDPELIKLRAWDIAQRFYVNAPHIYTYLVKDELKTRRKASADGVSYVPRPVGWEQVWNAFAAENVVRGIPTNLDAKSGKKTFVTQWQHKKFDTYGLDIKSSDGKEHVAIKELIAKIVNDGGAYVRKPIMDPETNQQAVDSETGELQWGEPEERNITDSMPEEQLLNLTDEYESLVGLDGQQLNFVEAMPMLDTNLMAGAVSRSEDQLLAQLRSGDDINTPNAIRDLWARWRDPSSKMYLRAQRTIQGAVQKNGVGDAEDFINTVIDDAVNSTINSLKKESHIKGGFKGKCSLDNFFMRNVDHRMLDHLRRIRKHAAEPLEQTGEDGETYDVTDKVATTPKGLLNYLADNAQAKDTVPPLINHLLNDTNRSNEALTWAMVNMTGDAMLAAVSLGRITMEDYLHYTDLRDKKAAAAATKTPYITTKSDATFLKDMSDVSRNMRLLTSRGWDTIHGKMSQQGNQYFDGDVTPDKREHGPKSNVSNSYTNQNILDELKAQNLPPSVQEEARSMLLERGAHLNDIVDYLKDLKDRKSTPAIEKTLSKLDVFVPRYDGRKHFGDATSNIPFAIGAKADVVMPQSKIKAMPLTPDQKAVMSTHTHMLANDMVIIQGVTIAHIDAARRKIWVEIPETRRTRDKAEFKCPICHITHPHDYRTCPTKLCPVHKKPLEASNYREEATDADNILPELEGKKMHIIDQIKTLDRSGQNDIPEVAQQRKLMTEKYRENFNNQIAGIDEQISYIKNRLNKQKSNQNSNNLLCPLCKDQNSQIVQGENGPKQVFAESPEKAGLVPANLAKTCGTIMPGREAERPTGSTMSATTSDNSQQFGTNEIDSDNVEEGSGAGVIEVDWHQVTMKMYDSEADDNTGGELNDDYKGVISNVKGGIILVPGPAADKWIEFAKHDEEQSQYILEEGKIFDL